MPFAYNPFMRILLTNDDGIEAPGLRALYGALRGLGEIAISAPDRQYSAASHSISLHHPFRVQRDVWPDVPYSFAVGSSPADCVRLAVLKLLPKPPDLIVSGINQGANYGTLVLYSGNRRGRRGGGDSRHPRNGGLGHQP